MCAVAGVLQLRMVAHVYRQEVYAGHNLTETIYDESEAAGGILSDKE